MADTWDVIARRLRTEAPDRVLMLKGAVVIEALAEEVQKGLHGPFGHLVIARGLNEEHWRLSSEPENDADHVSLPMFTKVDPFSQADITKPAVGGNVDEALNWTGRQIRAAKRAMKESAALGNGFAKLMRPETIERIRAKRATRHGRGPLPGLSPAATPVSEAGGEPVAGEPMTNTEEPDFLKTLMGAASMAESEARDETDGGKVWTLNFLAGKLRDAAFVITTQQRVLAKPASSPAGGREALFEEALIGHFGTSTTTMFTAREAGRQAAIVVRDLFAALSQSTSAGRVGE